MKDITPKVIGGKSDSSSKGGTNKIHTGPRNGRFFIVIKDGKRFKKYITKQSPK
jgi:hypothetical protein